MAIAPDELSHDGKCEVTAPSGSKFFLLTQDEADYFTKTTTKYQNQIHLTNISDLQDLDRVMFMETLVWRWGCWLSQECDYWGGAVDLTQLKRFMGEFSHELRLLKRTLGIDKATREREKGTNLADYIENLRARAKEFGVMREEQLTKAITLFQDLRALMEMHRNCDEREREEQDVEIHDIIDWIDNVCIPEFEAIDQYFQEHQQRFWIRDL